MIHDFTIPRLSFSPSSHSPSEKSICINTPTEQAALDFVKDKLAKRQGFAFATINLFHVVKLSYDASYYKAYRQHDAVVADGFPIVWFGRIAGKKIQRTPGSDLMLPIVKLVHDMGGTLAMVGTTQSALDAAAERLKIMFPGLKIVLTQSPAFNFDPQSREAEELIEEIKKSDAWICLLAFGAPKQEMLAALGKEKAPRTGFVSIGAGIDFIAGHQIRAPHWIRQVNMEWFWRLALSPKRLFVRYFLCALFFPVLLVRSIAQRKTAAVSPANAGYSSAKLP